MRPFILVAAVLLLSACPKKAQTVTVTGTDDQQIDQYFAKLEELRSSLSANPEGCPADVCSSAKEVCSISARVCEIAAKNPDRADFQERCGKAQEDCANFNNACARCG